MELNQPELILDEKESRSGSVCFCDFSSPTVKSSDAAAVFFFRRVQSAFGLGFACPAASSFVFAIHHSARAGPATNARITLIVQRIVRNILLDDHAPDLFLGPIG